jgi:NAD(P) transhydrogenase
MSAELVHIGAYALANGDTIDAFIRAVYNYPTLSDAYKYAAYDGLGKWEQWQAQGTKK